MRRIPLIAALLGACTGEPGGRDDVGRPSPPPPLPPPPRAPASPFVHHDQLPAAGPIQALWRVADDDVWAVADGNTLLHWNGRDWLLVSPPQSAACGFHDVWASARDDVWVSHCHHPGSVFDPYATEASDAVLHWDGARWSEVPVPPLGALTLDTMHGSGPADIWFTTHLAGRAYRDRVETPAVVLHWDGVRIVRYELPSARRTFAPWAESATDAWLLADGRHGAELWHWNGKRWVRNTELGEARDLWVADGDVWARSPSELRHRQRDGRWTSLPGDEVRWMFRGPTPWARTTTGVARWATDHWAFVPLPAGFEGQFAGGTASDAWVFGARDGRHAAVHLDGQISTTRRFSNGVYLDDAR